MNDAIVSGIVSGLVTGVVLAILFWIWRQGVRRASLQNTRFELTNVGETSIREFKFGILHVKNDDGVVVNKVRWFKRDRTGILSTTINHPKNLGFQYKHFLDNRSMRSTEEIITWLLEKGYIQPSKGGGKPGRVWFLIPEKPTTTEIKGFTNNKYHPE